jgi:acyl-CoA synthetase (AMP-forming)/AMP-acid ligase II
MIVYTSGSTGRPKGALLHHQGIVEFSLGQNRIWPVIPLRTLNYFPVNHIGCVVDVSSPTLVAGGTIVFLQNFSPSKSLQLMEQEQITLWASVPSVFQLQYADASFAETDLSAVKLIVWEGAAMPADMLDRLLQHGAPLATNYGMTESCGAMTVVPPTHDRKVLSGTVGWPMPGVQVRLADGDNVIAETSVTGEIQARSAYNMLGYWNRPEATAETLNTEGWLATGDLGQRNPDGTYTIVGRSKEMYKSGGYNVYPREVENVIESHPQVDIAAVIGISDPVWQEVGIAYVLVNDDLAVEALEAHCRENLANYKIPKRFFLVRELPLLPYRKSRQGGSPEACRRRHCECRSLMSDVLYTHAGRVTRITLNRPSVRNAISRNMLQQLEQQLNRAIADEDVDVIVLAGAGRISVPVKTCAS